ncbi:hypothetical protein YC2023_012890 [Brassica napus]
MQTIESSPLGDKIQGEAVPLSQLNLVDLDLAGSESSKVETSGLRRKEGDAGDEEWGHVPPTSFYFPSVISKLTDVKASHVPYRDSKLIRILQSSLSGHDRVSITDEKSLIKKYQHEIRKLKEELEQLKQGTVPVPQLKDMGAHDTILLKQKLEDGQVKLQSRLEEEEEARAALSSRIQQLTKLILVSTKTSQTYRLPHRFNPRRKHSFEEEELAYLPYKRRDLMDDEDIDMYVSVEGSHEIREEKKSRKHGLLNWLKPKKRDNSSSASDQSSVVKSNSTPSTPQGGGSNLYTESRLSEGSPLMEQLSESREDREPPEDMETLEASNKIIDELDLMREHKKILSEEAALQSSSLKRLSDEAVKSPQNEEIKVEIKDLHDGIKAKNGQIATLEKQIVDYVVTSHEALDKSDIVQRFFSVFKQLLSLGINLMRDLLNSRRSHRFGSIRDESVSKPSIEKK